jgi:hypothetical protein
MAETDSSKYEAPRAVRLSDGPLGHGKDLCSHGSNALADCQPGNIAQGCFTGSTASGTCTIHGLTAEGCATGDAPSHACTTGGVVQHL